MYSHRDSLAIVELERVEIDRVEDPDTGTTTITMSCLAGLVEVGEPERYQRTTSATSFLLHLFRDATGAQFHVATRDVAGFQPGRSRSVGGVITEQVQVPARESWTWGWGAQRGYDSRAALLTALGDDTERTRRHEEYTFRWAQALTAAAENDSEGRTVRLSRAGFERACAPAGVDAVPDEDVMRYLWDGVYTYGEYTVESILFRGLARLRRAGIQHEQVQRDGQQLATATAAVPGDSYSRVQFAQAWAAAGMTGEAPDDDTVLYDYSRLVNLQQGDVAVSQLMLRLLQRRVSRLRQEAQEAENRCDECGRLIIAGCGLNASLGLACSINCFDAMANRPGRHAQRHR